MRRLAPRSLVALAATALLLFGCADDEPPSAVDDTVEAEETSEESAEDVAAEPGGDEVAAPDAARDEPPVDDASPAGQEPVPDAGADPEEGVGDAVADQEPSTPGASPGVLPAEDPCGPHIGREMEAFIDVAAPTPDQRFGADTRVALVGCSNVFEANLDWELRDATGLVIADGATSAACGSGCVGAFEDSIDLSAGRGTDGLELHVFSRDASDGDGAWDDLRQIIPIAVG